MTTKIQRRKGHTTLTPGSEMTIYTASELRTSLEGALVECASLDVNLSEVREIDTAGLQLLMATKRAARAAGKAFCLKGHSEPVLHTFELCGVTGNFDCPTETTR